MTDQPSGSSYHPSVSFADSSPRGELVRPIIGYSKDMAELVKRARYYQALIDIDLLEKGQSYKALNNTYIIFICTFGVFTGNRHKYAFRNLCIEDQTIALKDGTTKLFLSTNGEADDIYLPLKSFL